VHGCGDRSTRARARVAGQGIARSKREWLQFIGPNAQCATGIFLETCERTRPNRPGPFQLSECQSVAVVVTGFLPELAPRPLSAEGSACRNWRQVAPPSLEHEEQEEDNGQRNDDPTRNLDSESDVVPAVCGQEDCAKVASRQHRISQRRY